MFGVTTIYRDGRFWIVDSVSLDEIETFPSFASFNDAVSAIAAAGLLFSDPGPMDD